MANECYYLSYSEDSNITFIMLDVYGNDGLLDSTEVKGFVFGKYEYVEEVKEYIGAVKAEYGRLTVKGK